MLKDILKHILIMIVFTIIIVLTMPYLKKALQDLVQFYPIILGHLSHVFAGGKIGILIKEVIAISAIPIIIAAIVNAGYYIIKRGWMPHIINITWILWIIITSALVLLRG